MEISQIQVINLKKQFDHINVLNGINSIFFKNHSYSITGVSGSGKSTLLHLLAGLDNPTEGKILFNDKEIKENTFFNKKIGLVFQYPYLIKELTVLENIIIKGLIYGENVNSAKIKGLKLLETINLKEKAYMKPSILSGGQQQRIAILRAVFNRPDFLLADEPTGNLDEKTGQQIIEFLLNCKKKWKMGLIISSHDKQISKKMKTIFQLKNGVLINKEYNEFYAK